MHLEQCITLPGIVSDLFGLEHESSAYENLYAVDILTKMGRWEGVFALSHSWIQKERKEKRKEGKKKRVLINY